MSPDSHRDGQAVLWPAALFARRSIGDYPAELTPNADGPVALDEAAK
jgi:hypothetical protein